MQAGDLLTTEFEVVHPDATLGEVVAMLQASETDWLPVCEENRLVGLIRSAELAPLVRAQRGNWRLARVRNVLAPEVFYCFENTDVAEAAVLMRENQVRHLPVLNADRKLVGMLALNDIPPAEMAPGGTSPVLDPERAGQSGRAQALEGREPGVVRTPIAAPPETLPAVTGRRTATG